LEKTIPARIQTKVSNEEFVAGGIRRRVDAVAYVSPDEEINDTDRVQDTGDDATYEVLGIIIDELSILQKLFLERVE
jgi:hypothetical protein